jgi:cytochrome c-type biogenesis protein CcmH
MLGAAPVSGRPTPNPSRDRKGGLVALVALALLTTPAHADSLMPAAQYANSQLPDARQEAKAKALMETLRCLVCQGQSIADSDAEMAGDMRALVRQRIEAGEKPEAIRAWLVQRYGKWVSYEPPLDAVTWPLWALPLLLLGAGAWIARGRFKRRGR